MNENKNTLFIYKDVEIFKKRLQKHIQYVYTWYELIRGYVNFFNPEFNITKLCMEGYHDFSKLNSVFEFNGYVLLQKIKILELDYNDYPSVKNIINKATLHHIKNNKHHPEYWDDEFDIDNFNLEDRDSLPLIPVDARNMPLLYLCEMIADWFAMSEELNSDVTDWADKTINKRWLFNDTQIELIYELISDIFNLNRCKKV